MASITISPASAPSGTSIQVSGSGFRKNASGTVRLDNVTVKSFSTNSQGSFSTSFVLDAAPVGPHAVCAVVIGTTHDTKILTVTAGSPPPPPPPPNPDPDPETFGPSSGRPFTVGSAWNLPIPANPVLDPNSANQVAYLSSGTNPGVADLYEYGVPVWNADANTPKHNINCTRDWGTSQLDLVPVPIPTEAFSSGPGDGAMVVIDWSTRKSYEFYDAQKTSSGWTVGWGGICSIDGSGTPGQAVGSGISRLAGLVRCFEIAQGYIDHALVFSTDNAAPRLFQYPASKTDGRSTKANPVQEGARLQLDPTINIDALSISPAEKMIGRALQKYGAYVIDNGGAKMAYICEKPSGESDPYPAAGLLRDYAAIRLPWNRLRVLRKWDGT